MTGAKLRLAIAVALFLGWVGWLGYAAVYKSRAPVISRAQAAAASTRVVAEISDEDGAPGSLVTVTDPLLAPDGPGVGTKLRILNLPDTTGFIGQGAYLLLLTKVRDSDGYIVVGQQRSPGFDLGGGKPTIYPWSADVRVQAKMLFPENPQKPAR